MAKRLIYIVSSILGGFLLLLVLLVLLVRLGCLNNTIIRIVENQAAKNMHGQIHIQSLQGNIFSDFKLENMLLCQNNDTLLSCHTIHVNYRLWALLQGKIEINQLTFTQLHINLVQEKDSTFNWSRIMKVSEEQDTLTENLAINLEVKDISLLQFSSHIHMLEKLQFVPRYLEANLKAALWLDKQQIEAELISFDMITRDPLISILDFSGKVRHGLNTLSWKDVKLQLNNTLARSNGDFDLDEWGKIKAEIQLEPLDFSDFNNLMSDFKLYGAPTVELSIGGDLQKYSMEASVNDEDQAIRLSAELSDLHGEQTYVSRLSVDGLDLNYWMHKPDLKSQISGYLQLNGKGLDVHNNEMTMEGNFRELSYDQYNFKNLQINNTKNKGDLKGKISTRASFGDIQLDYDLSHIFTQAQYRVKAAYQKLNLQHLPGIDSIYSLLNGDILISGSGSSLDRLNTHVIIHSKHSKLLGYPIDDFEIQAHYHKGDYRFTGLDLKTPYFNLWAQGKGKWTGDNHIDFDFEALNISPLLSEFDLSNMELQGKINGQVNGKKDSLTAQMKLALNYAKYDSLQVGESNAHIMFHFFDEDYQSKIDLQSNQVSYQQMKLQKLELTGDFSKDRIDTQVYVEVNDSLNASIKGSLEDFENPLLGIQQFNFNYNEVTWNTKSDSMYFLLDPKQVYIHDFNLNSGTQHIHAHGIFSFEGTHDLSLDIKNVELQSIPLHLYLPQQISGRLSSSTHLSGTARKPLIKNETSVDKLSVNNYLIDQTFIQLFYENDLLTSQSSVRKKKGQPIHATFKIPLHVSFSDSIYLLKDIPLFSASIDLDSLDMNALQQIYPMKDVNIKGSLSAHIEANNTIHHPQTNGYLFLSNGMAENAELGIYYKDIQINASMKQSLITLNELSAKTNKRGQLNMNGSVDLKSEAQEEVGNMNIKLKAVDFQALKSDKMDLNMDGDLLLTGSFQHPLLNGQVTLNRSRINADYFNDYMNQKTDDPNPPLLLQAMEDQGNVLKDTEGIEVNPIISSSAIFDNLRGKIDFTIPSNSWVRGKDMNVELYGALQFIKSTDDIDIVGNINVKKGSYKMYGRNFDITAGELNFTGGKEINPYLDFTILYKFRDVEKELRTLQIQMTGRMLQPEMSFFLDEEDIDEKDAIAYIVFKKSADYLSDGQKKTVFSGEELAMGLVLDQLSMVLKESLKQKTGLDVIDISGDDNWKTSNVTLGKYITNKLYLSYERAFILDKKTKAVNTEKMMLEYEFIRNIVLKATNQNSNSGFDLIFKQKWK